MKGPGEITRKMKNPAIFCRVLDWGGVKRLV